MMIAPAVSGVVEREAIRPAMSSAFADSSFRLTWLRYLVGVCRDGTLVYTMSSYLRERAVEREPVWQPTSYVNV